jgi:hypothetical protein
MTEMNDAPMGSQAQAKAFLASLKADGPPPAQPQDAPAPEAPQEETTPYDQEIKQEPVAQEKEKRGPGRPRKEVTEQRDTPAMEAKEQPSAKDEGLDDYQKSLIDEYEDAPDAPKKTAKGSEKQFEKEEVYNPTEKEMEYDNLMKDPLMKAVLEWRKNGGNNPKDFVSQLGLNEQPKTMREHFEADAAALGLEGDELEEAVEEAMSNYESLPIIERRKKELEYKNRDSQSIEERLKSFTVEQGEHAEKMYKIQDEATRSLEQSVSELANNKFKGMLIDEPMAKVIERDAPMYSPAIFDEQGNLKGYDIERGITAAIAVNYLPKLLRETYMLGKTAAATQYAKERHRPNADPSAGSASVAYGRDEALDKALSTFANKFSGKRS